MINLNLRIIKRFLSRILLILAPGLIVGGLYFTLSIFIPEIRIKLGLSAKEEATQETPGKSNKYFNAIQVKFSYALTCHKTQGGQWENVFIEQPYLPDGEDNSYLRWLYTAVTRAQKKLFLIGFKETYFEDS